jgi:hypothetical protein
MRYDRVTLDGYTLDASRSTHRTFEISRARVVQGLASSLEEFLKTVIRIEGTEDG